MKTPYTIILFLAPFLAIAQQNPKTKKFITQQEAVTLPITILLLQDSTVASLAFDRRALRLNQPYQFQIINGNTAHMSLKINSKPKEITYAIPEPLKSILPNITQSTALKLRLPLDNGPYSETQNLNQTPIASLRFLALRADSLYRQTKYVPNPALAQRYWKAIQEHYKSNWKVDSVTVKDIQYLVEYIKTQKRFADVHLTKDLEPSAQNINGYSQMETEYQEVLRTDYTAQLLYILKSIRADQTVSSKVFTPEKDLVEVTMTLVDTYSADTLYNKTTTFYTMGSKGKPVFGLGFSTGFFYTHGLGNQAYYIAPRDDEKVNVLPEKRMKHDVAIGALAHLYWKTSPCVRLGVSLGLATSPLDGKTRYLLGKTLLLGKEKLLGFSGGWAIAKTTTLSSSVIRESDGSYTMQGKPTQAPMVDGIKGSYFLAVTYNIAGTRK